MSDRRTGTEFEQITRRWTDLEPPVAWPTLEKWRKDWENALRSLPYVRSVRLEQNPTLNCLLSGRVVVNASAVFEGVQADLERVWSRHVSEGLEATHSIANDGEAIALRFAAKSPTGYVIGRITCIRES